MKKNDIENMIGFNVASKDMPEELQTILKAISFCMIGIDPADLEEYPARRSF